MILGIFQLFLKNGGHLGRHLEFTKMLNDASPASCSFWFYTTSSIQISNNLLGGYFCKVGPLCCWTSMYYTQCLAIYNGRQWGKFRSQFWGCSPNLIFLNFFSVDRITLHVPKPLELFLLQFVVGQTVHCLYYQWSRRGLTTAEPWATRYHTREPWQQH